MGSNQNTLKLYTQTLLTLVGSKPDAEDNPLFGHAVRQVKHSTIYHQTAHRLLHALIQYSPAPEQVASQFLTELAKCENANVVSLVSNLSGDRSIDPDEWAAEVYRELKDNGGNIESIIKLASYYLTHLIIAFRNPGGTTPQDSFPPTPDLDRAGQIKSLLESATISRNQGALKKLVLLRDGLSCVITGEPFEGDGHIIPDCAHIIPFSFHEKVPVLTAIEMFTGKEVQADTVREFINNPANAINLQADAHRSMDQALAWGIEARLVNNEWKYYFRIVKFRSIPRIVRGFINDGDEIHFGRGTNGTSIALPEPQLCNLHLAIARVFTASGFAEVVEKYMKDNEENSGSGTFVEELARKLQELEVLG